MHRAVVSLALLSLWAASTIEPSPAAAAPSNDLAAVRGRVAAAMQSAKSFVVTTSASTGFNVTMTFVAPDRYHSVLATGTASRDVVLIGPVAYVSDGGGGYRKTDAPPEVVSAQAQLRDIPIDTLLPDKTIGGRPWGQFTTTSAGPQKDQHLVCTYDKRTYRIADCANEGLSLTFSRYDDPANAVSVPANVVGGKR